MADQTTTKPETDLPPTPAPAFDPATRATELASSMRCGPSSTRRSG